MNKSTVYLVDDDAGVLKALSRLLRAEGWSVSAFSSAQDFLDALPQDALGCVVLDLAMPAMDGTALHGELIARGSVLGVIFLTGHGDLATGIAAMKTGAVDFLGKPVNDAQLLAAVRAAVERSRAAHADATEIQKLQQRLATLTPREREVMSLVVTGQLNKQIAATLGIAEKTIKVHRARVMEKMHARSLAELVRMADRAGVAVPGADHG
jgi:FixJ family two-component response regulator